MAIWREERVFCANGRSVGGQWVVVALCSRALVSFARATSAYTSDYTVL